MDRIDAVYVACYRHDIRYTRACVASIRRWHPDVPLYLIKDSFYGDFETGEIESCWNVRVLDTGGRSFSWGFSKLEPLFLPPGQRFMILDSDIVLAGPVVTYLEGFGEDFLVQHEDPTPAFIESNYYNVGKLRKEDPGFSPPGYTFNTGQWVGRSGLLSREDFGQWVKWGSPPALRHPETFRLGEQGLLNYVLQKKAASGQLTLRRVRMMETPPDPRVAEAPLAALTASPSPPFVIHWCGMRNKDWSRILRGDLWRHHEKSYYRRVPFGPLKRRIRPRLSKLGNLLRRLAKAALRVRSER